MRLFASLVLAVWLVALLRTILNLLLVPRLRGRAPSRTPLVSLIVPARDEERTIERAVRGFLAQTYPALEVIVVNDRSVDSTGAILDRLAAEDARLTVVHGVEPEEGWLGKPWALHEGSRCARGELLLFVDADVIYEPGAVSAAVTAFEDLDAALITLLPRMELHGFWEHVAMVNLAMTAFTMLPLWSARWTRMPKQAVGGGTGNLVHRGDYDAAGGHEALKGAVIDDVALARLIRTFGGKTIAVRAEELVSVRMYHGLREIVNGFTKNTFSVFGRSYLVVAFVFLLSIAVNIVPYVLAFTGDPLSLATVAVITIIRVILFSSLGLRLDNALFGHPLMTAVWGWIILRSTWVTGVRRKLHWRGRIYDATRTRFGGDRK